MAVPRVNADLVNPEARLVESQASLKPSQLRNGDPSPHYNTDPGPERQGEWNLPFQLPILPCSGPRKKLKIVSSYIKKETKTYSLPKGQWERGNFEQKGWGMDRKGLQNSLFFKKCLVSRF